MLRLRPEALEWRGVDDEIVALDLDRSEYLHLNPSGAALWQRLVSGATRPQLVRHLVDAYGVAEDRATTDVDAFIADLAAKRLLDSA